MVLVHHLFCCITPIWIAISVLPTTTTVGTTESLGKTTKYKQSHKFFFNSMILYRINKNFQMPTYHNPIMLWSSWFICVSVYNTPLSNGVKQHWGDAHIHQWNQSLLVSAVNTIPKPQQIWTYYYLGSLNEFNEITTEGNCFIYRKYIF